MVEEARRVARSITWRYLLALGLIASLSTGTFLALFQTLQGEEKRAQILHVTTRQQALSQRIGFFANAYAAADSTSDREDYYRELGKAIRAMQRNHEALINGDEKLGLGVADIAKIRGIYFEGDYPFDRQVRIFLEYAEKVYNLTGVDLREDHPALLAMNLAGTNFVPQTYELIADLIKTESQEKILRLEKLEVGIWLSTLVMLVLEALFIFRPLSRDVRMRMVEAEDARRAATDAASEARHASAVKSRFLAMMSHEIRTPMNAVLGMTGVLMDTALDDKQRQYALIAKRSGEHLLRLLNDILDLSRLDSGKMEPLERPFGLKREVETVLSVLAPAAREKGVALTLDLNPGSGAVLLGDPHRLRQVMINLVNNAIKFTDKGRVTLSVRLCDLPGESDIERVLLRLEVTDTGIGIAPEDQRRLFKDFEQIDSSQSRKHEGTGLGLSICKRIVDLLGGNIGVVSALGEGSTFWIEVPYVLESRAEATGSMPREDVPNSEDRPRRSLRILVAEDNPANQLIIRLYLEKDGHSIRVVGNGLDVLQAFAEERFDIVLMDIQMPEMDGIAATRAIRDLDPNASRTPIVALTAHVLAEEIAEMERAGVDAHVGKPLDFATLRQVMVRLVAGEMAAPSDEASREGAAQLEFIRERPILAEDRADELRSKAGPQQYAAILKSFWHALDESAGALDGAVTGENLADAARMAHTMAGSAAMVGADRLEALARAIESRANAGREDIAPLIAMLRPTMQMTRDALGCRERDQVLASLARGAQA